MVFGSVGPVYMKKLSLFLAHFLIDSIDIFKK